MLNVTNTRYGNVMTNFAILRRRSACNDPASLEIIALTWHALCVYVAMWLCSYVAAWLYGYVAMWLCVLVAMWLCG